MPITTGHSYGTAFWIKIFPVSGHSLTVNQNTLQFLKVGCEHRSCIIDFSTYFVLKQKYIGLIVVGETQLRYIKM
jgi:hypothetical protein